MANETTQAYSVGSKSYTAVAISAAAKAGEWIRSKLGEYNQLNTKNGVHDLVTEIDKGAETMIRKLILTHFPNHLIFGEEGVEPGPAASAAALSEVSDAEFLWIVDPLDGTTNFVHGFPFFSVSIALAIKGEVIVGVVYNPNHDEMFVAEKGKGAYLRGKKMAVAPQTKLIEGLIATGLPADRGYALPVNLKGLQELSPKVRNIRVAGSAALHMAYVAAGRLNGFWEIGLNAWDIAAGALMIQESGGKVTDTLGNPYSLSVRNVVGTNGYIHQEMLDALREGEATG